MDVIYAIESFLRNSYLIHTIGFILLILSFYVKYENIKNVLSRLIHDSSFKKFNINELHKSSSHFRLSINLTDFTVKSDTDDLFKYLVDLYYFIDLVSVKSKSVYVKLNEHDNYTTIYPCIVKFFIFYKKKNGIKFIFQFRSNETDKVVVDKLKKFLEDINIPQNCIKVIT